MLVAWRDGNLRTRSRVRVARFDGAHVGAGPRTVGYDAAQVVLTARGASASVGWTSSYHVRPGTHQGSPRRALPRTLTVQSLDRRGAPAGLPTIAARDVGATARMAGAPDGRLVATWARPTQIRAYPGEDHGVSPPPDAYVFPRAFTRQVLPVPFPARPVGADEVAGGPPSVAFDGPDHALTVVRAGAQGAGPMFDVLAAGSSAGGPWSDLRSVAALGFSRMDPIVLAPAAGDAVVVYTALDATINAPPRWIVAATDSSGPHRLGTTVGNDGKGATAVQAGRHVLVAWDDGQQVQVAERG